MVMMMMMMMMMIVVMMLAGITSTAGGATATGTQATIDYRARHCRRYDDQILLLLLIASLRARRLIEHRRFLLG
uniref:Putative secreted protein n=1 Tax=Anopheles darlingi TaxID=43151 RepID=A0A2M4DGG2_ANODA